jgi:hypothetical protein
VITLLEVKVKLIKQNNLVDTSVSIAGYVSICVQLYCVGFHCFATCFGLHGHLQGERIFYFHMLEGFCFVAFFLPYSISRYLPASSPAVISAAMCSSLQELSR